MLLRIMQCKIENLQQFSLTNCIEPVLHVCIIHYFPVFSMSACFESFDTDSDSDCELWLTARCRRLAVAWLWFYACL